VDIKLRRAAQGGRGIRPREGRSRSQAGLRRTAARPPQGGATTARSRPGVIRQGDEGFRAPPPSGGAFHRPGQGRHAPMSKSPPKNGTPSPGLRPPFTPGEGLPVSSAAKNDGLSCCQSAWAGQPLRRRWSAPRAAARVRWSAAGLLSGAAGRQDAGGPGRRVGGSPSPTPAGNQLALADRGAAGRRPLRPRVREARPRETLLATLSRVTSAWVEAGQAGGTGARTTTSCWVWSVDQFRGDPYPLSAEAGQTQQGGRQRVRQHPGLESAGARRKCRSTSSGPCGRISIGECGTVRGGWPRWSTRGEVPESPG